jgi:hypothetical protein
VRRGRYKPVVIQWLKEIDERQRLSTRTAAGRNCMALQVIRRGVLPDKRMIEVRRLLRQ